MTMIFDVFGDHMDLAIGDDDIVNFLANLTSFRQRTCRFEVFQDFSVICFDSLSLPMKVRFKVDLDYVRFV